MQHSVSVQIKITQENFLLCFQELLSRTSLETQKLDLMAEVSDLKIKLVGMEKEQSEYEEKQNKAEVSFFRLFSFFFFLSVSVVCCHTPEFLS